MGILLRALYPGLVVKQKDMCQKNLSVLLQHAPNACQHCLVGEHVDFPPPVRAVSPTMVVMHLHKRLEYVHHVHSVAACAPCARCVCENAFHIFVPPVGACAFCGGNDKRK